MDTDFPADRVLPPGTGLGHGGYFFMAALNHYNARRIPRLKKRGLKPIATEPEIVKDELLAIKTGALQSDCTLYLDQPLSLVGNVGARPWHMTPATNFMEIRPYVAPMRAMAQAALNHARNEEPMHAADAAERIYLHVAKIGRCLRMHPGCLQDIELGLEIELNGLHYLEVSLKHRGLFRRLMDCEDYAASVKRLETAVRRKYSQLGNVEAAKWVLRHDREPIWRSEAGFALVSALHLHEMSLIEQRTCRVALHEMLRDPVKSVRAAGVTLQSMPETEFVAPSGQPPAGGESAGL